MTTLAPSPGDWRHLEHVPSSEAPLTATRPLDIYLVDDHPLVLSALTSLLSDASAFTIVGQARSGEDALRELPHLHVDVAVLGYHLGAGMDGVALCSQLSAPPLALNCLALTSSTDLKTLRSFRLAGALGYLVKHADGEQIVNGILTVAAGGTVVDAYFNDLLIHETMGSRSESLTPREHETLQYAALGLCNRDIADRMLVSTSSVKGYLASAMRKLGAQSRTEAVAIASRKGLLGHSLETATHVPLRASAAGLHTY